MARQRLCLKISVAGIIVSLFLILSLPGVWRPAKEVRLANVTDSSVAVSWITEKPTQGAVILSLQANPFLRRLEFFSCGLVGLRCWVFGDEMARSSTSHYVVLKNLKPETAYYYRIYSGGRLFKTDKEGKILPKLATAPTLVSLSLPNPIYARVVGGDGKTPVAGALVYLSLLDGQNRNIIKSQPLTTFTDSGGVWLLDLGNLRSFSLVEAAQPLPGDFLFIKVWAPDGRETAEFVEYSQTKVLKPIIIK